MDTHQKLVTSIAEQVLSFHEGNIPFRIYHGSTNSTRIMHKDPDKIIDTSALHNVISIDMEKKTAVVEPNVPMDVLVQKTLLYGLVPAVVPEFPGITVGGSFSGTAAESSSFKFGYFDRTVNLVEIILPNGTVVKASPDENSELFYGAAGAMGTLGVTTLFEIQLIPSTTFVTTTYLPVKSISNALTTLEECTRDKSISYLDAVLFSACSGVIVVGRLDYSATASENVPSEHPIVRFSRAKDSWFFLHAHDKITHPQNAHCIVCTWNGKSRSTKAPVMTERIPIYDYFFRYDRGSFWMGAYGWKTIPLPFNRFGRWCLDRLFRTRTMYTLMHHSGQSQRFIVQDLAIPAEKAEQFLDYVNVELQIFPLWLCPIKGGSKVSLHTAKTYSPPTFDSTTADGFVGTNPGLINIGVWGIPNLGATRYSSRNFHEFIALNRDIERVVREVGGLKWLYAHNYYTEDEFWQVYDREMYEELRKKFRAEGLPSLWDKVRRDREDWRPVQIGGAILKTVLGTDYLVGRKK
jgi:delta24-sterol reductase